MTNRRILQCTISLASKLDTGDAVGRYLFLYSFQFRLVCSARAMPLTDELLLYASDTFCDIAVFVLKRDVKLQLTHPREKTTQTQNTSEKFSYRRRREQSTREAGNETYADVDNTSPSRRSGYDWRACVRACVHRGKRIH